MRSLLNAALTALAALAVSTGALAKDAPTGLPIADPAAVVGEPYSLEGVTYTPADAPFDDVGYAGLDDGAGSSVSISHRTMPLPSYVEITALNSGRTILARVERRGPMAGRQLVALSAAGFAQLEADSAQPLAVRVRRVNPQEYERALLRTNQRAPERLVTPGSLLEVLRKLLARKSAPAVVAVSDPDLVDGLPLAEAPPVKRPLAKPAPTKAIAAKRSPAKPVVGKPTIIKPVVAKSVAAPTNPTKARDGATSSVQIAAFANRANADATAKKLGAHVSGSGKLWRVHYGPFTDRAAAEAGLARAKKAGFGDARIANSGK